MQNKGYPIKLKLAQQKLASDTKMSPLQKDGILYT